MKTKILLLLFAVFTISGNAQTFDWETGTLFNVGCTDCAAEQTVNGNYVSFRDTNSSLINLSHVGVGTTGLSVRNSQAQPESFLTFYPSVNIQSLRLFATANNQNWTISQLDDSGNVLNTITATVNIASSVVALNWTNVHQIEIKVTAGYNHSFGVDDIVFTSPCPVNIPDTNFKNYLVGNTAINTNGDAEIQCSEASAFSGSINVNSFAIADLTGIEAFTALTELLCANNQLTSLDLSANTALTKLACNNNQLISLDVSNSTALTELRCDTNQLTSLDVSNNTALMSIICFSNLITNIDVSSNTALTTLDCSYNQLTSIDVSANTALTTLSCRTNQLTSLDVSSNTDLRYINCFDTQLTSLDFSINTALTTIFCGDNTQLTSLNVANGNNTNVVNFNTTNNPNLTCIQVDDAAYSTTNWTNIDAQTSFSTNCTPCTVNIPDANFKAALVGNTAINTNGDTEIQCSEASAFTGTIHVAGENISDLTGIAAFVNITRLECYQNSLTSLDVSSNTSLSVLVCSGNSLTSLDVSGATALTQIRASSNSLTSLDVSNNTALSILICSGNYTLTSLNTTGITALTELECHTNLLTDLDVSTNTALTRLFCDQNNLTSLDVSNNIALEYLSCNNNDLTNLDASSNTVLTTLRCDRNSMLTSLNVANGNNSNVTNFAAQINPSLACIQIDPGFTPSTGWYKDTTASYSTNCAALSVNDYELQHISIHPNPVNNTLNIQLEEALEKVEVYSILGRKVLEQTNTSINVSSLSNGVYLLKVTTQDGKVGVKRFIKK